MRKRRPDSNHRLEIFHAAKAAVGLPMLDDSASDGWPYTRHSAERFGIVSIYIDRHTERIERCGSKPPCPTALVIHDIARPCAGNIHAALEPLPPYE